MTFCVSSFAAFGGDVMRREYVLSADEIRRLGGADSVNAFRVALHGERDLK